MKEKLQQCGDLLIDEELSKHTTLRVGGKAKYFIYPSDEMNLIHIIELCKEYNKPYKIFGNGSNILASDDYFDGVIINLNRYFNNFHFEDDGKCFAQAGVSLILLAAEAMRKGLSGLEFASGIPASVGGAVYMNAGAYKSDMSSIVKRIYILENGVSKFIDVEEAQYEYRTSVFQKKDDLIILGAEIQLTQGDFKAIKTLVDDRRARRMETQPLDKPSAGSMFRNPKEGFSWKFIDDCGLRGKKIGGAQISEKHSNFIVNNGDATAQDIADLVSYIQEKVKEEFNVSLHTEVERFNWKKEK